MNATITDDDLPLSLCVTPDIPSTIKPTEVKKKSNIKVSKNVEASCKAKSAITKAGRKTKTSVLPEDDGKKEKKRGKKVTKLVTSTIGINETVSEVLETGQTILDTTISSEAIAPPTIVNTNVESMKDKQMSEKLPSTADNVALTSEIDGKTTTPPVTVINKKHSASNTSLASIPGLGSSSVKEQAHISESGHSNIFSTSHPSLL